MEIVQIFLLDQNLHILFGQERQKIKSYLQDLRKSISEALHNNYSHLVHQLNYIVYVLIYK